MDIIKSDIVSLHGAAISMIGGRPENQDDIAYLDTPLGFLIVVCDGMGGGPGGKTASNIVKLEIAKAILESIPLTPRDHAFRLAAARAHQALEDKMKEYPSLSGMGSTFVAILLNEQSAVIAHTGDSRCYRLHGTKCLFRTQDHSLVAELVKKKVMTEEDARLSPQANVITRGLGSTNNHVPEIDEIPYKKGDRFILCTDGIWGAMQHQDLLKVLTQPKDIQQLLTNLSIQIDNIGFSKGGGHDNHTIAMFELEKDSLSRDMLAWRKWVIFSSTAIFTITLICLFLWHIFDTQEHKEHSISNSSLSGYIPIINEISNSAKEEAGEKYDDKACDSDSNHTGYISDSNQIEISARDRLSGWMSRIGTDSDSITTEDSHEQEKGNVPNSIVTVQKVINRYQSAKVTAKHTILEAEKNINTNKKEIKELLDVLEEQTRDSETHRIVEMISHDVDNPKSWYIDKVPDPKTKLYVPTATAKEFMDIQIDRLKRLKEYLEKESKN